MAESNSEDDKVAYKIPWWKTEKIETSLMACTNCLEESSTIHACKYSINEYDKFSEEIVLKSKSAKLCGKCNYFVQKVIDKKEEAEKLRKERKIAFQKSKGENNG